MFDIISLKYILLGLFIGFLSGMFGIGGSMICTPLLKTFFAVPSLIALASPLPAVIPISLAGVMGYSKNNLVNRKIALITVLSGLPATVLGAFATKYVSGNFLMVLTGVFVVLTGIRILYKIKCTEIKEYTPSKILIFSIFAGFFAGFLSGFLAIGGGIVLVPAFIILFGLSMQEAAATSLFCVAFFAVPGTLVHWKLNHIDWLLALNLSLGVFPASYFGSRAAVRIKSKHLQLVFSLLLIVFGVYFIFNQAG